MAERSRGRAAPEERRASKRWMRLVLGLSIPLALIGCARSVPTSFPARSAASLDAPPAPAAVVTRTLEQDPPLPGEAMRGWEALGPAHDHSGHGAHHAR